MAGDVEASAPPHLLPRTDRLTFYRLCSNRLFIYGLSS